LLSGLVKEKGHATTGASSLGMEKTHQEVSIRRDKNRLIENQTEPNT
jgi:hypothetical protein